MDILPEPLPEPIGPIVDRPNYLIPTKIMKRPPTDPVTEPSPAAAISSITSKDNEIKAEHLKLASSGPSKVKTEVDRDDRSGLDRSMKINPEKKGDFDRRSTEAIDRMKKVSDVPPGMQIRDDRDVYCGVDRVRDRSAYRSDDKDVIKVVQHKEDEVE